MYFLLKLNSPFSEDMLVFGGVFETTTQFSVRRHQTHGRGGKLLRNASWMVNRFSPPGPPRTPPPRNEMNVVKLALLRETNG